MNTYSIALFFHIVGALGLFVALGLEWTGLWQIRSAMSLEPVRAWMGILKNVRKFGFVSMLTTVITGIYLMVIAWGGAAWIYATLGSLVVVMALAQGITAPRMAAIGKSLVTGKGLSSSTFQSLASLARDQRLWISLQTRVAIALGIVFLKIAKPDMVGSLLAIGVAIVLGVASALPVARFEQAQEGSAD